MPLRNGNRPVLDAVLNADAVRMTLYKACLGHYALDDPNATRVSDAILDVCRELRADERRATLAEPRASHRKHKPRRFAPPEVK